MKATVIVGSARKGGNTDVQSQSVAEALTEKGFEVDTIADWKRTFAIEIKSANEPEAKLSANTKKYLELLKDEEARSAVFYLGDITMNINGTAYVGWRDWGEFLK